MNQRPDPDDITADEQQLLARLAAALGPDPLPHGLLERSEQLATWLDVDAELNALLQEAGDELVGTRGGTGEGLLFATSDRRAELVVDIESGHINGQLITGESTSIQLVGSDGEVVATDEADDLGSFNLTTNTTGPHRIVLTDSSGRTISTDWFVLS